MIVVPPITVVSVVVNGGVEVVIVPFGAGPFSKSHSTAVRFDCFVSAMIEAP